MTPDEEYYERPNVPESVRKADRIAYELTHFGRARESFSNETKSYLLTDGTVIDWDDWFRACGSATWALQDWEQDDYPGGQNHRGVLLSLARLCRTVVPC